MNDQLDALCPIFFESDDGVDFYQLGTGVFLYFRGLYFILTAGHVIDEIKRGALLVPVKGNEIQQIDGSYSYFKPEQCRSSDMMDVGYFKLEFDFAEQLKSLFTPIEEHEIHYASEYSSLALFSVSGYPHRKSKIKDGKESTEMFSYGSYHAKADDYKTLGCTEKYHVVSKFDRKKSINPFTKEKQISPLPHGISGGGIFIWPETLEEVPPKNRKLTAIGHTYKEKGGYFIGTNISVLLQSILKNNPELATTTA